MSIMKMDVWVGMIKDDETEFKIAGNLLRITQPGKSQRYLEMELYRIMQRRKM